MSLTVNFMPDSRLFSTFFSKQKNADMVVAATFFGGDMEKAIEYFKDPEAKYDIRVFGAGAASPDQKYPLVDVRVYTGDESNGVNNNIYLHFVSAAAKEVFDIYCELATLPQGEQLQREVSAAASELCDQIDAYLDLFRIPLGDSPKIDFSLGEYHDIDIPEERESVLVYVLNDVKADVDAYMALAHAGNSEEVNEEEILCKQDLFEGTDEEDEIESIDGTPQA